MEDQNNNNQGSDDNKIASILGIADQDNNTKDSLDNSEVDQNLLSKLQSQNSNESGIQEKKSFFSFLSKNKINDNETKKPSLGNFLNKNNNPDDQKKAFMKEKKEKTKSRFSMLSTLMSRKKVETETTTTTETTKNNEQLGQENAFTKIFNSDTENKKDDFIDTIIESAKKQQEKRRDDDQARNFKEITNNFKAKKNKKEVETKEDKIAKFAKTTQIIALCSLIVPIISFTFFYAILTPDNFISNMLGSENYGKKLETNEKLVADLTKEIEEINKKKSQIETKIGNINDNAVLKEILSKRINWLSVISKVEEVANQEFHNSVTHVVDFSNYSGKSSKSEISIQGSVKDPGGMSFTQLTKLIEAMNSSDYFSGAAVRSFTKTEDTDGSAKSSFNLTFLYTNDVEDEWKDKLQQD